MNSEYATSNQNINNGNFVGQYSITPSSISNMTTITNSQIKNELTYQIAAGKLPAATLDSQGNPQTYYVIFFPPGIKISIGGALSCDYFCAYHDAVPATGDLNQFYYGVHPDMQAGSGCDQGCGEGTIFQNYCQLVSHEMTEMVTGTRT